MEPTDPRDREALLALLRSRIGALPPRPAPAGRPLPTGIAALDRLVGGWPAGAVSEVVGPPGTGRLALVEPAAAALARQGRPVAVVDPLAAFHPPGWRRVPPASLLLVRPPAERTAWAVEQLAASGAVPLVVVLDAPRWGRAAPRVPRAAATGGAAVVAIGSRAVPGLGAALRLAVEGWRPGGCLAVRCIRRRDAPTPEEIVLLDLGWDGAG